MKTPDSLPKLPPSIGTYLSAVDTRNADLFDLCFAPNAVVHDESHEHRGLDAIKAWKKAAEAKYRYTMEPMDFSVNGDAVKLHAKVTGNFPGSPIELDYVFTLAADKITSLQIE